MICVSLKGTLKLGIQQLPLSMVNIIKKLSEIQTFHPPEKLLKQEGKQLKIATRSS